MATNAPAGDGHRNGMVRKRSQIKTKVMGEEHWTKRSRKSGKFMDQKEDDAKFKGVRREKKPAKKVAAKKSAGRKKATKKTARKKK